MVRLLERRFRVRAPLEKAWAHLEKVEQWPSWAQHSNPNCFRYPGVIESVSASPIASACRTDKSSSANSTLPS
jgi:hypothetical protein